MELRVISVVPKWILLCFFFLEPTDVEVYEFIEPREVAVDGAPGDFAGETTAAPESLGDYSGRYGPDGVLYNSEDEPDLEGDFSDEDDPFFIL